MHSNCSDGTDPPAAVVERAARLGVVALALTDHDCTAGLAEAKAAAREHGLDFLTGVELSAAFNGLEVHVVGLGIRPDAPELRQALDRLQQARAERGRIMLARLQELGVALDPGSLLARDPAHALGRLHIAKELKDLGYTRTVQQGFDRYIGRGRPAFVEVPRLTCDEAVALIHNAGGLAFIGHPGIGSLRKELDALLRFPFDGIEAYHPKHSAGRIAEFDEFAVGRGLLVSGGSDCHGKAAAKPTLGTVRMPLRHYESIRDALARLE